MTVLSWLDDRTPAPPPALRHRIGELVAGASGEDEPPSTVCLRAAETALNELVRNGDAGRAGALDLLAVDALVTYAFEAAADEPGTLATRATHAMARLSRLAAP